MALFLFRPDRAPLPRPQTAYEEVHSQPQGIQEDIGRIDRAVYEVLYRWGVYESNILFTDVGHRYEDGDAWDFTEITVLLPDAEVRDRIRMEMQAELGELGPRVTWQKDEVPAEESAYRVYARERYTHRIRFVLPKPHHKGTPRPAPRPKKRVPRVAIIIDDLGYDRGIARAFASLEVPVALSVLPVAPRTREVAEEARRKGLELMLHLPMEPKGYPTLNPGPGALLNRMGSEEIRSLLVKHLEGVRGVRGVNNHMGSSFTEHQDKVTVVLEEVRKRGLYFVDSKTTAQSVAYRLARKMGVPAATRNVFLDNDPTASSIGIQVDRLLGVARTRGAAVGIAHPFPGTLKALRGEAETLTREAEVVAISKLTR